MCFQYISLLNPLRALWSLGPFAANGPRSQLPFHSNLSTPTTFATPTAATTQPSQLHLPARGSCGRLERGLDLEIRGHACDDEDFVLEGAAGAFVSYILNR